ncbi:MAG: Dethiobiotin synthetase [Oscillatoria sp. PMC 1068.18]|nr:Dethiobiotin synthetase [Oscillatoria sp. PMC 1068.18]
MDYETARKIILTQVATPEKNTNSFLARLERGQLPIPGQVTNILLALKILFENLRDAQDLDRELIYTLYVLAEDSREKFDKGEKAGIEWSPLLKEDIKRIKRAVKSIFSGVWE